ncbi:MAG: hypothetical protein HFJ12_01055 [Bacilli bacterium]|nr:hypothetical protein [Bacilli bacterium]
MDFIFPLFYFILTTGFMVVISKKSFGKCLPLAMLLVAFTYFFSQVIFKTFKIGFYLNILFAALFLVWLLISKIKRKDLSEFKKRFLSKGFYFFLVIYIGVFLFDLNRDFSMWDEFSHWGEMVKEMLRLDHFYSVSSSTLMAHKDYPPIVSLFELFFCNLSGGYQEAYLIRSIHLLSFSLFIPAICDCDVKFLKIKTFFKALLMMGIIFLTILLFDQHGIINTIYTDYLMAILVSYSLSLILLEKEPLSNFHLLNLSVACSFLVMTKQMGLPLYAMILFMFIFNVLIKNKFKIKKVFHKQKIFSVTKIVILLFIIPLSLWKGWDMYVNSLHLNAQFKLSDLKLSELGGIIKKTSGEQYQQQAAMNYMNAIKNNSMTTSIVSFNYLQCAILVFLLLYLIYLYRKKYFNKGQIALTALTLAFGFIGYAFVMLIMYVFSFGPVEGPNLASFNRYLPTYVLICMLFIVMLLIYIDSRDDKKSDSLKKYILIFCILILIQKPSFTTKITPQWKSSDESIFEYHAKKLMKKTKENSKIFLIAQNSTGEFQFFVKYYMNPRIVNRHRFNLPVANVDNYKEYFEQEIKNDMISFDYLYLAQIDDEFREKYQFLFSNSKVENEQLYKIKKNGNNFELILQK